MLTLLNTVMDGLILFKKKKKRKDLNFWAKIVKRSCPVSWLFYEIKSNCSFSYSEGELFVHKRIGVPFLCSVWTIKRAHMYYCSGPICFVSD